jgi:hypothetical protein
VNGFDALMKLAGTDSRWLPVVSACLDYPSDHFAAGWIIERVEQWPGPNFRPLVKAGILERAEPSGRTPHYRVVDRAGVKQALAMLALNAARE